MTQLATLFDAIPFVRTTAERDERFPSPVANQRVQNLETETFQRYSGSVWADELTAGFPEVAGEVGVTNPEYPYGDVRRYGVVADLSTNQLPEVQNAVDSMAATKLAPIVVPGSVGTVHVDSEWWLRATHPRESVQMASGTHLIIQKGAALKALPSATYGTGNQNAVIIVGKGVEDVTIEVYGEIIGNWNELPEGEDAGELQGGEGIGLHSCKRVHLHVPGLIRDVAGDGVFVGGDDRDDLDDEWECENISIDTLNVRDCSRQGISIVGVKGMTLNGLNAWNIGGTAPGAAIDIENHFAYHGGFINTYSELAPGATPGNPRVENVVVNGVRATDCWKGVSVGAGPRNVTVTGVTLQNCTRQDIQMGGEAASEGYYTEGVSISDVTIRHDHVPLTSIPTVYEWIQGVYTEVVGLSDPSGLAEGDTETRDFGAYGYIDYVVRTRNGVKGWLPLLQCIEISGAPNMVLRDVTIAGTFSDGVFSNGFGTTTTSRAQLDNIVVRGNYVAPDYENDGFAAFELANVADGWSITNCRASSIKNGLILTNCDGVQVRGFYAETCPFIGAIVSGGSTDCHIDLFANQCGKGIRVLSSPRTTVTGRAYRNITYGCEVNDSPDCHIGMDMAGNSLVNDNVYAQLLLTNGSTNTKVTGQYRIGDTGDSPKYGVEADSTSTGTDLSGADLRGSGATADVFIPTDAASVAPHVPSGVLTLGSIANNSATTIGTVTIPNAAHSALFALTVVGSLGAGGTIGANEASASNRYLLTVARTAGVNAVGTLSSAFGAAASAVAGADTVTAVLTLGAVVGAVGAVNTLPIQVTVARGGGASSNHTAVLHWELLNANASGLTVA